ncbi:serine/threonine-protein kinase [Rhodococcus sp. IEGM 1366]|uniref:serine/threonine-protein kinase n=1 Tax=Rhodococcus sp. IEGM 1366 TaxID=3082223 RepID=UPI0029529FB3|nr:serine/threonine-protein kinase [Rhodococcus sp. IEGM 1366]MDV8065585.1 serine/threonine-protein kinase [Rhodococcus sp. IEGM 1366]
MVEKFGRYELQDQIGQGGMGQVWRAYDHETDRYVALKLLPKEFAADSQFRARFVREAQIVAKLQHPNIVPIHSFGEIDDCLYIDMALLDGTDMETVIRRTGRLSLKRTTGIIQQVASVLDSAHSAGLVHRDIKPANIFLHTSGHIYLIDFGIAYQDGMTALTSGVGAIGTLAYMAPERYDGVVGPAVDVYSLTCVLFELLTGERPFSGASAAQQVAAHLTHTPPSINAVNSEIPVEIDSVILRGMAKDPSDRYQSCTKLIDAVTRNLSGESYEIAHGRFEELNIESELAFEPVELKEVARRYEGRVYSLTPGGVFYGTIAFGRSGDGKRIAVNHSEMTEGSTGLVLGDLVTFQILNSPQFATPRAVDIVKLASSSDLVEEMIGSLNPSIVDVANKVPVPGIFVEPKESEKRYEGRVHALTPHGDFYGTIEFGRSGIGGKIVMDHSEMKRSSIVLALGDRVTFRIVISPEWGTQRAVDVLKITSSPKDGKWNLFTGRGN